MDWVKWLIVAAIIVGFLLLKRARLISATQARAFLQQGAKVIDVRTEQEYRDNHIPGAINLPLDSINQSIAQRVPDKNTPVLLHCAGGVRSGMARARLRKLGYTKAYNLGSYGRAASIVARIV
jgi:rhodanese-related sulfurtransferase